jgi:hypothetical protein
MPLRYDNFVSNNHTYRAVFFNLGSAEPRGSAKVILGSAKYLNISLSDIDYKHSELKIINLPRFLKN